MKSVALGLVVEAGMERDTLGTWDPAMNNFSPVIMWGRRKNGTRRVVGLIGMVTNGR